MKISTVLVIGFFGKGALENFYVDGLKKLNINVSCFDIVSPYYAQLENNILKKIANKISVRPFFRPVNDLLLSFLEGKHFDVILVFKGMELFPETIKHIKQHTTVLTNYNADHPFLFFSPGSGNSNVLKSIPHYDIHFSYAKKIVIQLKQKFGKDGFVIPFGYDSNAKINSMPPTQKYENKFLFIGAYDRERSTYLNKLKLTNLEIYGDDKWASRNARRPYIENAFQKRKLLNEELVNAVESAKGIINLLRPQNIKEDSHNMRTFEVPGYRGLLITQRTTEQSEFFEEGKEIIFFDSPDELKDKLKYLISNPSVANELKSNAQRRCIKSGYSYDNRSQQMIAIIEKFIK